MSAPALIVSLLAPLAAGAAAPATFGGAATLMAKAQHAYSKDKFADALTHLQAAQASGALTEGDRRNALWMEFLYLSALQKLKDADKALEKFVALEPVGTPEPWLWEQTPPKEKQLLGDKQKGWQAKNGVEIGEPFVVGAALHVPLEKNAEKAHHLRLSVKATGDAVTLEAPVANKEGTCVVPAELWSQTDKSGQFDVTVEAYAPEGTVLAKIGKPVAVRVVPGLRRMALEELKSGRAQATAPVAAAGKGGATGAGANPNFTLNEGTAKDTKNNLTWQRRTTADLLNWAQAKSYCDTLTVDGGKWRLPTTKELKTIIDTRYEPAIDKALFPDAPGGLFWSASAPKDSADKAWAIDFDVGSPSDESVTTTCSVRCVR